MAKDKNSPYLLPPGWAFAQLSQLVGANGLFVDGDWIESKDQNPTGKVRLIQLADIGDGLFINKSARFLTLQKANELKCTFLQYEDILIARMPEPLGRACLFPFMEDDSFVTAVDICIFRPHSDLVCKKFLMHIINSPSIREIIDSYKSGSTRKRISRSNLDRIKIPIAPLAEQKRIAVKIEELFSELDAGVENLKRAKEQLSVYRQSLLKQAFEGKLTANWRKKNVDKLESGEDILKQVEAEREDYYKKQIERWKKDARLWPSADKNSKKLIKPREQKKLSLICKDELNDLPQLPKSWSWVKVGAIAAYNQHAIKAGPFGSALKKQYYTKSGYKIYGQEQVISGQWDCGDYYIDESRYRDLESCKVQSGDILISLVGTIGKVLVLPDDILPGIINPRLIKISPNKFYLGKLFKYYFESSFVKNIYKLKTHGATMDVLNLNIISEIPLPFFSIQEQLVIIEKLDRCFSSIANFETTIEKQINYAEICRQKILEKAFSGKLTSHSSADEPASDLLKKIRAERESAPKLKRKSKIKTKKQGFAMADLITVLTTAKDWINTRDAFSQCGISNDATTDEVEKIYGQLKQYIEQKLIEVDRRGDDDWLRMTPKE